VKKENDMLQTLKGLFLICLGLYLLTYTSLGGVANDYYDRLVTGQHIGTTETVEGQKFEEELRSKIGDSSRKDYVSTALGMVDSGSN